MKVKRFNESAQKLSVEIAEYIENFHNSVDHDIPDWINTVSKQTKLNEYKNVFSSTKKTLEFADEKNLKKFKEYTLIFKKIEELQKAMIQLEKNKEILYLQSSSELLYKFQEELISKDPENFRILFLDERLEDSDIVDGVYNDYAYTDIHPDIYKKYKNEIEVIINMKKYNL